MCRFVVFSRIKRAPSRSLLRKSPQGPKERERKVAIIADCPYIPARMSQILHIRTYGDPVLREKARPVESIILEIPEPYDRDEDTGPRLNPDVPLALALVNPTLIEASSDTCSMEEGCLSFPDIRGNVERPWSIVIEHLGLDGQPRTTRLEGFFARAVQHEMDHLAGDLFIDHFSHVKKFAVRGKLKRLQAETLEHLSIP